MQTPPPPPLGDTKQSAAAAAGSRANHAVPRRPPAPPHHRGPPGPDGSPSRPIWSSSRASPQPRSPSSSALPGDPAAHAHAGDLRSAGPRKEVPAMAASPQLAAGSSIRRRCCLDLAMWGQIRPSPSASAPDLPPPGARSAAGLPARVGARGDRAGRRPRLPCLVDSCVDWPSRTSQQAQRRLGPSSNRPPRIPQA